MALGNFYVVTFCFRPALMAVTGQIVTKNPAAGHFLAKIRTLCSIGKPLRLVVGCFLIGLKGLKNNNRGREPTAR